MSTSALSGTEGEKSAEAFFPFVNTFHEKLNGEYAVGYIHVVPVLNMGRGSTTWQVKARRSAASFPTSVLGTSLRHAIAQLCEEATIKCHGIHVT